VQIRLRSLVPGDGISQQIGCDLIFGTQLALRKLAQGKPDLATRMHNPKG
jgi:hypothetical protein